VYASRPSSPAATQHSLEGGALLPYPRRTFTGWKAPASLGALSEFATEMLLDRWQPVLGPSWPMLHTLNPRTHPVSRPPDACPWHSRARNYQRVYSGGGTIWKKMRIWSGASFVVPSVIFGACGIGILPLGGARTD
jgi:hypothetical protein